MYMIVRGDISYNLPINRYCEVMIFRLTRIAFPMKIKMIIYYLDCRLTSSINVTYKTLNQTLNTQLNNLNF